MYKIGELIGWEPTKDLGTIIGDVIEHHRREPTISSVEIA